ncbi:DEAD/DEAH box helicase [Candidatus Poribacteria bacterium]|nr:DEAD/DEAH box helicase [Candidatus Poribacteria bacterium]
MRAQGIDNSEGRQHVLLELYEKFFANALKKDAERLGIVYTPVEVVDFILHSANEVLQKEFARSLSDEGVHVLDPFTGTGIFLARLLQSDLIQPFDLERKYRKELHANEIVLLAYYIAAVNIEEAYRGQRGEDSSYEPFNGIVLTDTFNLNEWRPNLRRAWLPDNNARVERQQNLPIQVIVGNPPWSAGQKSATDDNPNVEYPELEDRIEETYATRSTTTLKRHLYDTYKMAIRWASDRIKEQGQEQGVVAFVTNGSWIDGNADAGVRACLAEEFSSIYVLHLRGNARTSGELRRAEGDNVFGLGSRAPVALTILVKNPNTTQDNCRICYRDIGDYLKRGEKLMALREAVSISGFGDWQEITPDKHYDWIGQRSEAFAKFYPLGSKNAKMGRVDDAIFGLYSLGLATGKDAYLYNFSRRVCAENARKMTQDYLSAFSAMEENPKLTVDMVTSVHSLNFKWDRVLKDNLKRKKRSEFDENYIRKVVYRPFIATNCYADYTFVNCKYQIDQMFPDSLSENRVICVAGKGGANRFSVFVSDTMTDLQLMFNGQCFPRYQYPKLVGASDMTAALPGIRETPDRIDNISDTALRTFQEHYNDETITKDAIFDYVYGILHAPSYREEFANDLSKMIPRIPFSPDFHAFAEAGKALAALHLGYETCEQYRLSVVLAHDGEPQPHHFRLTEKAMRFATPAKTTLIINEHVRLTGIPEAAHRYVVNGRTPLEWFIDRYKIKRDKESGILNDPNGWFKDPRDLVTAIERIVYVSVESTRIIEGLPSQITDDTEG